MSKHDRGADVLVPGIDGGTPLGFLAALGLLQVIDDSGDQSLGGYRPSLYWKQLDAWRPVFVGVIIEPSDRIRLDRCQELGGITAPEVPLRKVGEART